MTLHAVMGKGNTLEEAITVALNTYNKEDDTVQKTFHHTDLKERWIPPQGELEFDNELTIEYLCIIWYTARRIQQQEPEYKYIGSEGINPNDPDWLKKWELIQEGMYQEQPSLIKPLNVHPVEDTWTDEDTEWRLNTTEFGDETQWMGIDTPVTSPEGSGLMKQENPHSDTDSEK